MALWWVIHGNNTDALANPEALDFYRNLAECKANVFRLIWLS